MAKIWPICEICGETTTKYHQPNEALHCETCKKYLGVNKEPHGLEYCVKALDDKHNQHIAELAAIISKLEDRCKTAVEILEGRIDTLLRDLRNL